MIRRFVAVTAKRFLFSKLTKQLFVKNRQQKLSKFYTIIFKNYRLICLNVL